MTSPSYALNETPAPLIITSELSRNSMTAQEQFGLRQPSLQMVLCGWSIVVQWAGIEMLHPTANVHDGCVQTLEPFNIHDCFPLLSYGTTYWLIHSFDWLLVFYCFRTERRIVWVIRFTLSRQQMTKPFTIGKDVSMHSLMFENAFLNKTYPFGGLQRFSFIRNISE